VIQRYILHNDKIREGSDKILAPGQVGLLAGWGVFTTIRAVDGVLFAFDRHWARMSRDAVLFRVPLPEHSAQVHQRLLELVEANQAYNSTMRVVVFRNSGGMWEGPGSTRASDLIALTAPSKQWGAGVKLMYMAQARHAASKFAGAKILSWAMNLTWVEEAQEKGFDELALLNERGEVSECTSANIFVAQGSRVYTPPLSSGCLPGITREVLLSEIHAPGFPIGEKTLMPADLENADEVFITSTTRLLLPVLRIEQREIRNAGRACSALHAAFSRYVEDYVAQNKRVTVPAR